MAGKSRGAAARIQEAFPKTVYTHCAAHALNLCVECCSVAEIRNMMNTVESINFVGSFQLPEDNLLLRSESMKD